MSPLLRDVTSHRYAPAGSKLMFLISKRESVVTIFPSGSNHCKNVCNGGGLSFSQTTLMSYPSKMILSDGAVGSTKAIKLYKN